MSLSAASVALNDRPGVSDSTRRKVNAAARKLGYAPDVQAAAMRSGKTRTIGFVSGDLKTGSLASLVAAAAEAGLLVVAARPDDVALLVTRNVDGLIVSGSDKAATAWAKTGRPLVIFGEGRVPRGAVRVSAKQAAADVVAAVLGTQS